MTIINQEYGYLRLYVLRSRIRGSVIRVRGVLFSKDEGDGEKRTAYECGFNPFEDARIEFELRYYLLGIIFILFDLEVCIRIPWVMSIGERNREGYIRRVEFVRELLLGYVYAWKKGGLEWE